jgi:hypothetical protein
MEKQVRNFLYYTGEACQFKHRILPDGEIGGNAVKLIAFVLFFAAAATGAFSSGRKEKNNSQPLPVENPGTGEQLHTGTANTVKLIGRVQIYGNEPHTFAGIVDEEGTEYAVYPPAQEAELRLLQGNLIEFIVVFLDGPRGEGGLYLKGGTVTPISWEIIR